MIQIYRDDSVITHQMQTIGSAALDELRDKVGRGAPTVFQSAVYGADVVRLHLWSSQHYKCCYCERPIGLKFQHVEHFRPKSTARRTMTQTDNGYWWIAYDLDNLLYSCPECNNYKRDWFPLEAGSPVATPEENPRQFGENPTFIDPLHENPENDIFFDQLPTGRWRISSRTDRGWKTITRIHLDSDPLDKQRQRVAQNAERRSRVTSDTAEDVTDDEHFANLVRSIMRAGRARQL